MLPFYNRGRKEKKCLKKSVKKKSDLVAAPSFHTHARTCATRAGTHTHTHTYVDGQKKPKEKKKKIPTTLALVPLKHMKIHRLKLYTHAQILRNLILLKIIPPTRKETETKTNHQFVSPSENTRSFLEPYCTTGQSDLLLHQQEVTTSRDLAEQTALRVGTG